MRAALETAASGLRHCDFETVRLDTWIGAVAGVDEVRLPVELARHDCRNHRLALLGSSAPMPVAEATQDGVVLMVHNEGFMHEGRPVKVAQVIIGKYAPAQTEQAEA